MYHYIEEDSSAGRAALLNVHSYRDARRYEDEQRLHYVQPQLRLAQYTQLDTHFEGISFFS